MTADVILSLSPPAREGTKLVEGKLAGIEELAREKEFRFRLEKVLPNFFEILRIRIR